MKTKVVSKKAVKTLFLPGPAQYVGNELEEISFIAPSANYGHIRSTVESQVC